MTETNRQAEHSAAPPCSLTVHVGEFLFEFSSFERWVSKASSWFTNTGVRGEECLCVDSVGRLCRIGKQFMRARDEGTFPVRVYRMTVE